MCKWWSATFGRDGECACGGVQLLGGREECACGGVPLLGGEEECACGGGSEFQGEGAVFRKFPSFKVVMNWENSLVLK